MAVVILDILNPDEEEESTSQKPKEKPPEEEARPPELQKQVINIDGDIVPV